MIANKRIILIILMIIAIVLLVFFSLKKPGQPGKHQACDIKGC